MGERFRFVLFIVFSITTIWFTIILMCLPRSDPFDQWQKEHPTSEKLFRKNHLSSSAISSRSIQPPRSPVDLMRFFQTTHPRQLSLIETLFYDFNPIHSPDYKEAQTSIAKSLHEKAASNLSSINNPTDQLVKVKGDELFAFNLLASNRIGLSRSIPDTRPAKCPRDLNLPHDTQSPIASIIICYYNEAPSALLRTIHSIISRTPIHLVKEIIIVDDFSESGYDMHHILPHLDVSTPHRGLIKYYRTIKREGLIRARLFGAEKASGDVLVFLDSHVEANIGWLEPLIEQIQANSTTIACPMIDLINAETMIYSASPMVRGGLSWALHFKWDSVPAEDLKTHDDFARPIKSASMAGGLYAIDRKFFYHLGAYDPGMNLWGGENIEMSMRTWMCGGRILILPCSRLGHIFRKTRPYGPSSGEPDSLLYNSHRSARVWLDDYIDRYFESSPEARNLDSGDISARQELRKRLQCKNFTWFLENIYPKLKQESINKKPSEPDVSETDESRKHHQIVPLANSKRIYRSTGERVPRSQQHKTTVNSPVEHNRENHLKQWNKPFLQNFYPPVASPKIISNFQIQLMDSNLCIEPKANFAAQEITRLVLNDCLPIPDTDLIRSQISSPGGNISSRIASPIHSPIQQMTGSQYLPQLYKIQLWSETELHDYRLGIDRCLDIMKNLPLLRRCSNMPTFQAWAQMNNTIGTFMRNYASGELCLAVERAQRGEPIITTVCDRERKSDENLILSRQFRPSDSLYPMRDSKGGKWLTGPLSEIKSVNHRSHRQVASLDSPHLKQKWIQILV